VTAVLALYSDLLLSDLMACWQGGASCAISEWNSSGSSPEVFLNMDVGCHRDKVDCHRDNFNADINGVLVFRIFCFFTDWQQPYIWQFLDWKF
jgi:hypothetical protein